MDTGLFRNIISQVAPLTEQVAFHLMGDPLVHPKLPELVSICNEFGVRIFLVTNGVLLRERHYETLLNQAFRQINISLHSFPDNFGDRDPSTYLDRIFRFIDRAFTDRPDLYLNFRLWNLSSPKAAEPKNLQILEAIEQHFGVHVPRNVDVRKKKSIHLIHRLYLHLDTEFIWPSMDLPVLGTTGSCYGLKSHFGILMDGTVVPCCLDKEGAIPLGNMRERPILDILSDERAQQMLKGFQMRKLCEGLCHRCQYIERFHESPK